MWESSSDVDWGCYTCWSPSNLNRQPLFQCWSYFGRVRWPVGCEISASGIFDDFCISICANCIFDHLCIGTLGLGSWRFVWGFLSCSWWCPTALGELPQGGWSLRHWRNGSRNHQTATALISYCFWNAISCWSPGSIWRKGTDRGCNRLCQERQNLSGFNVLYMSCW